MDSWQLSGVLRLLPARSTTGTGTHPAITHRNIRRELATVEYAASPVGDPNYLSTARPGLGVDGRYVVLPRVVLEHLPPSLQQQIITALAEVHCGTARYPWPPAYRVTAVEWRPIGELVEGELREIGVDASLDTDGDLVHRDGTGRRLTEDELAKTVPVSSPDPFYPTR